MESKQMFSDAKEGDRVWSITAGWGTVYTPVSYEDVTGIAVKFDNGGTSSYYPNGKLLKEDERPELYWNEIKFEAPEKPKRKVKKEFDVWVNVYPSGRFDYPDCSNTEFDLMFRSSKELAEATAHDKVLKTAVPVKIEFEIEE